MKKNGKLQTPENHRGIRAFRRRVYRALVDLRCGKACPGVHPAVSAEGLEQPCQNVCKRNCIRTSLDDDL